MGLDELQRHAAAWVLGTSIAGAALPVEAALGYAYGQCVIANPLIGGAIRPTYAANDYLFEYRPNDSRYKSFSFTGAKVTLVKAPKHGEVVYTDDPIAVSSNWYTYLPKESYLGKDRFVMDVEKNGVKVRIHYLIQVIGDEPEYGFCHPEHWKISSTTDSSQQTSLSS